MNYKVKKIDSFDYEVRRTCKNCDNQFAGRFCNVCGEKVIEPEDRSLFKLFENIFNAFTFVDSKFWNSFNSLFFKPGRLSDHVSSGIQVPYMTLIGLFFLANFLYFLFPVFDTYNSTLSSQENSDLIQKIVKDHIKTNNLNVDTFTTAYNDHSSTVSKLLLISLVFLFTIPLFLFNIRKNKLFFDHLLASFEFNAFSILIPSLLFPFIFLIVINLAKQLFNLDWTFLMSDQNFSIFGQAIFIYFLYNLQRRFYKDTMLISGIKSICLSFCVIYSWKIYRFILFFVTFYTM